MICIVHDHDLPKHGIPSQLTSVLKTFRTYPPTLLDARATPCPPQSRPTLDPGQRVAEHLCTQVRRIDLTNQLPEV